MTKGRFFCWGTALIIVALLLVLVAPPWWNAFLGLFNREPQSPAGLSMAIGRGSLAFYRWKDGPTVIICCDIQGGSGSMGESFSGPPWVRKETGSLASPDGRRCDWELETTDGRHVTVHLDNKEYDLQKGTVFLVKTKGGKTEVEQFSRDLSSVQPDNESCKEFARKDSAMSTFLGMGND
jgi:hypothetical protein